MASQHRVVIVGGGFGGLSAAIRLKNAPVEVTLIDRCNYHLFQPLLYQVATGTLSPANIASPLRNILKRHKNTRVLLAEAIRIDAANRRVILSDGSIEYDTLVVGSHGHGGFIRAMLGSVSQHVVSHSQCPVVVVPAPQRAPNG